MNASGGAPCARLGAIGPEKMFQKKKIFKKRTLAPSIFRVSSFFVRKKKVVRGASHGTNLFMQSQRAAPPATCWLLFRLDAHGREQKKKKEKKIRTSNLNEKNSISIQATRRENVIPATNRSAGLFQFVGLFVATTVTQEALTEFFFYLKYILKFFH